MSHWTRRGAAVALAGLLVVWPSPAPAHPVPFSYLDSRLERDGLSGTLVVHILDVAHELGLPAAEALLDPRVASARSGAIARLLGARLHLSAGGLPMPVEWMHIDAVPERQSLRLHLRVRSTRAPSAIVIQGVLFPYDPNHRTFLNIYEAGALTQAILDRDRVSFEYFAGTRQGTYAVVRRFLPAGVHHILIGPDHLLFLVAILLLGGSIRRLALIVTGFTLAHSVTLSLAALGILLPPARVIEPAIALSIVYVGVDNLLVRQGRDVRPWVAVAFGLIHGFGFANVLREMDLPSRAVGWSLFAFNLGVELGQLAVVVGVAGVLAFVRSRSESGARRVVVVGSAVVIAAGGFWFVQRVWFSGGLR